MGELVMDLFFGRVIVMTAFSQAYQPIVFKRFFSNLSLDRGLVQPSANISWVLHGTILNWSLWDQNCNAPSTIYCDRSTATNSLNPIITCLLGIGLGFGLGLLLLLPL
eukprot:scaffold3600_cov171-Amphora_coffeaeformis.AAC.2